MPDDLGHQTTKPPVASLPQPTPLPPPLPEPRDVPYPGVLKLSIDARDTERGIVQGKMLLPVAEPGPMTLVYPKWMPGYHSPKNPLALFAGLEIRANGERLHWRRDLVEVHAFHLEVPQGADALHITFQFVSPTNSSQGEVVVTHDILSLQFGRMLLYPAGYFARGIQVELSVTLPDDFSFATALTPARQDGAHTVFEPTQLDILVDSPLMAGRYVRDIVLDEPGDVRMTLFGHQQDQLQATEEQIAPHRALIAEADALFASRHYNRYRFLMALTEELGGGGVEHQRSAEIIVDPDYFTGWDTNYPKRDVMGHEFVHSWNGKFRRGADSWSPTFDRPIGNSLMWLYEGQTQYWGQVLAARSGLWTLEAALGSLAKTAATYDVRPGGLWRTMADTTRDPIIAGREPLPWPSWQRSEDYYSQGLLMWLAIDTKIRELTGDERSLDDFAKAFFGVEDGRMVTLTYDFDEVVATLRSVADHDWARFLNEELESREPGAPLEGVERGGYRLVYRDYRNSFCKSYDALVGMFDMRFSIGLTMGDDGTVQEVMWGSPAFDAGLTAGTLIQTVNGQPYSEVIFGDAIEAAKDGGPLKLAVKSRSHWREVDVDYRGGHRFPHLEPIDNARRRLDEIYAARA